MLPSFNPCFLLRDRLDFDCFFGEWCLPRSLVRSGEVCLFMGIFMEGLSWSMSPRICWFNVWSY